MSSVHTVDRSECVFVLAENINYMRPHNKISLCIHIYYCHFLFSKSKHASFQMRLMKTKKEEEMKGIIRRYSGRVSEIG